MLVPTKGLIVFVVCPDHECSGKRYLRYLWVGTRCYDDPTRALCQSMLQLHQGWIIKLVDALCKKCG